MEFLKTTDFETGGQFEGIPYEMADKLINYVNGQAAKREQHNSEILGANIEALNVMQSKGIEPRLQKVFLTVANHRVKDYKRDEDGKAWRDSTGKAIFNSKYEKATTNELFLMTLEDVLQGGHDGSANQGGQGNQGHQNQPLPNLSGVKTRVEADNVIREFLKNEMGLTASKTPEKYSNEFARIRKETGADELPVTLKPGFY